MLSQTAVAAASRARVFELLPAASCQDLALQGQKANGRARMQVNEFSDGEDEDDLQAATAGGWPAGLPTYSAVCVDCQAAIHSGFA